MAHNRSLVARIKGLLRAGFRPKQLAHMTGQKVSACTIAKWGREESHADIAPDPTAARDVSDALLGQFVGDFTTR